MTRVKTGLQKQQENIYLRVETLGGATGLANGDELGLSNKWFHFLKNTTYSTSLYSKCSVNPTLDI